MRSVRESQEKPHATSSLEQLKLELSKLPSTSYVVEFSQISPTKPTSKEATTISTKKPHYNAKKRRNLHFESREKFQSLKKEFTSLRKQHENLISITNQLTMGLQNSIAGQSNHLETALDNCKKICPKFFDSDSYSTHELSSDDWPDDAKMDNKNTGVNQSKMKKNAKNQEEKPLEEATSSIGKVELSPLEGVFPKENNPERVKNEQFSLQTLPKSNESGENRKNLDFARIKRDLLHGDEKTRIHLIKSLRLEEMSKLLNAFAGFILGRNYLCQEDDLLSKLLIPLTIENHPSIASIDGETHSMLIATLQKLSIRTGSRLKMISSGMVEYLVWLLNNHHHSMSQYKLEYANALLMNLFTEKEGREKCYTFSKVVLKLMIDLLHKEQHPSGVIFINGILFHLLSDPMINKESHELNLGQILQHYRDKSNGPFERQFALIMKIYNEGNESMECLCANNDSVEEVDYVELELNEDYDLSDFFEEYQLILPLHATQMLPCFCQAITPHSLFKEASITHQFHLVEGPAEGKANFTENSHNANMNSSLETFCEDTQQFYHKPSASKGIFQPENKRKTNKIFPFLRNKFNSKSVPHSPSAAPPEDSIQISKSEPITPKSSDDLSCNCIRFCYKETLNTPKQEKIFASSCAMSMKIGDRCEKCSKRNKYSCNCYEAIKAYADEVDRKFANNNNDLCENDNTKTGSKPVEKSDIYASTKKTTKNNCYKSVFKSRPKILRTPPV